MIEKSYRRELERRLMAIAAITMSDVLSALQTCARPLRPVSSLA
jgi:hypothetical protein